MEPGANHILIVDDNLKNLQVTGKVLQDEGYLISIAPNGKQALELLKTTRPDIILLDVMMPEMDGLEVCRIIKLNEQLADIPILFLTAKNQTEDMVKGFQAGGLDYVTKPFHREELLVRVKNHLELANSRRKIVEMNKNRDKLYSIIAHDIKSPLSGITLTIGAIRSNIVTPGSDDYNEMLAFLEKSTTETVTLLNNLLSWAKIQSEVISIKPKITNIHSILAECLSLLQANANQKAISLTNNVPENFTAYFDEVTIHAVFRNIISNAIKFTPQKGSVSVNANVSNGYVNINFKDTGAGMPKEIIDKIMVRNQHHTSVGTNNEQGTGLGLVMVKDFVARNQGSVNINSKPGEGTEITVLLPLIKSQ